MSALGSRFPIGNVLAWAYVVIVLLFLFAPLLVVVPVSFNPGTVIQFPPAGLSTRWYHDLWDAPEWRNAAWLSVRLGVSVAVASTVLGLLVAIALTRLIRFARAWLRAFVLLPLIVPVIVTAIAMFEMMAGVNLVGTFPGLLIAHTILALPFAILILESGLNGFDASLEEAAQSLGASPVGAFLRVTIPNIVPSILGAALFSFLSSWDEVVVVLFVGGAALETLPLQMFEYLQTQIRPTLAAISTILVAAVVVALIVSTVGPVSSRRFRRRRRAGA